MILLKIMMDIMMTTMMMKLRAMVVIGNRRAGTGRSKVVDLSDTSPPATLRPSYYHNCGLRVMIVYYQIDGSVLLNSEDDYQHLQLHF